MIEILGNMHWMFVNEQSKSEGKIAVLTADDGETYKLYRPGLYPVNDVYFAPFDSKRVAVTGNIEARTCYICVSSIHEISDDNQEQLEEDSNE